MNDWAEQLGNIEMLASLHRQPHSVPRWLGACRSSGRLCVWQLESEAARRCTVFAVQDLFTLLMQEFHLPCRAVIELPLNAAGEWLGSSLRYRVSLEDGSSVGVHLLGDYLRRRENAQRLVLSQWAERGRFVVAVTADPTVWVRPASGWCVEVRTAERVWSLMLGNRSRKLRSVGPIRTDAVYALVAWPNLPCTLLPQWTDDLADLQIDLLDASRVHLNLRESLPQQTPDWVI